MAKVVESYSYEDQEVSINYNQGLWTIYASKRTTITEMLKKYGDKVEVLEVLDSGTPALVRLVTDENVISLRKIKTQEEKDKLKKRMSQVAKDRFHK